MNAMNALCEVTILHRDHSISTHIVTISPDDDDFYYAIHCEYYEARNPQEFEAALDDMEEIVEIEVLETDRHVGNCDEAYEIWKDESIERFI